MTYSYYTNIPDRRKAIKEAVGVLFKHDKSISTKGERQFLDECETEDSEGFIDAIWEDCRDLADFHAFVIVLPSQALEKRLEKEITKLHGNVEAHKERLIERLIEISKDNERIQHIIKENYENYYDYDDREFALHGCQWAFDDAFESIIEGALHSCFSPEDIEFCIKCSKVGVDTYLMDDNLFASIEAGDEYVINILASLKAYDYLEHCELCTYKWIENSLDGEDKVAEIASLHLDKVIVYKEDMKWLKEKAAKEVPQAQYLMALLYLPNDLNIFSENKSLAVRYLQAAKEGGCSLADAELQKLGADAATAFEAESTLLAKANKGNKSAMFELGNHYAFEGNDAEAKKWWNKANRKGHTGLKKRPINGCVLFLLAITISIVTIVTIGFAWNVSTISLVIGGIIGTIFVFAFLLNIQSHTPNRAKAAYKNNAEKAGGQQKKDVAEVTTSKNKEKKRKSRKPEKNILITISVGIVVAVSAALGNIFIFYKSGIEGYQMLIPALAVATAIRSVSAKSGTAISFIGCALSLASCLGYTYMICSSNNLAFNETIADMKGWYIAAAILGFVFCFKKTNN